MQGLGRQPLKCSRIGEKHKPGVESTPWLLSRINHGKSAPGHITGKQEHFGVEERTAGTASMGPVKEQVSW